MKIFIIYSVGQFIKRWIMGYKVLTVFLFLKFFFIIISVGGPFPEYFTDTIIDSAGKKKIDLPPSVLRFQTCSSMAYHYPR